MSKIANRYLQSQLGQMQEKIKLAKLAGKPIVFLQTAELSIVRELLNNRSIFANIYPSRIADNVCTQSSILYKLPDFKKEADGISVSVIAQPTLFVIFVEDTEFEQKHVEKTQVINENLFAFVQLYENVSVKRVEEKENALKARNNIHQSMVLIVSANAPQIPANIALYSEYIKLEPMQDGELKEAISLSVLSLDARVEQIQSIDGFTFLKDKEYLDVLAKNLKGLSKTKIKQIFLQIYNNLGGVYFENYKDNDEEVLKKILKVIRTEKEQLIATSTILTLEKEISDKKATGLGRLETYLKNKKSIVANVDRYKRERNMDPPKGVIVSGIPGSGKSLMAKYTAHLLDIPLIRMDMGDVQNKYVGESERRMVEALDLVNAMSPCVLWVDEIEKSLAGSSGNSSSDVTKRLFGKFLTWMQEKENKNVCCFVFATANDISSLPPELFRSGRFDAKFYTYMPSVDECGRIFESLIGKQCKDYRDMQEKDKIEEALQRDLFDMRENGINKKLFVDYLNSDLCLKGYIENNSEVNRRNKFFTGADVENVIKIAKEIYLVAGTSIAGKYVYGTEKFKEFLKEAIKSIKTYGETDLEKIATCYAGLASNNFTPASEVDIMPFEGYDEYRVVGEGRRHQLYQYENEEKNEEEYISKLEEKYDKCLYCIIRNILNRDGDDIINQKKKKG